MPTPETLLPVVEEFAPDVVDHVVVVRQGLPRGDEGLPGKALRVVFTSNFWHGTWRQVAGFALHRFYVDPLFDAAWVPGERSEAFARRIGFEGRDIIRGANSADVDLFQSDHRTAPSWPPAGGSCSPGG